MRVLRLAIVVLSGMVLMIRVAMSVPGVPAGILLMMAEDHALPGHHRRHALCGHDEGEQYDGEGAQDPEHRQELYALMCERAAIRDPEIRDLCRLHR